MKTEGTLGDVSVNVRAKKLELPHTVVGVSERAQRIYLDVESYMRRNPDRKRADAFRYLQLSSADQQQYYFARKKMESFDGSMRSVAPTRNPERKDYVPPPVEVIPDFVIERRVMTKDEAIERYPEHKAEIEAVAPSLQPPSAAETPAPEVEADDPPAPDDDEAHLHLANEMWTDIMHKNAEKLVQAIVGDAPPAAADKQDDGAPVWSDEAGQCMGDAVSDIMKALGGLNDAAQRRVLRAVAVLRGDD